MPNAGFNFNNRENTMAAAPSRSCEASIKRLRLRYRNIDFEDCLISISHYLNANAVQGDIFNKFNVAQRALFPEFGAAGTSLTMEYAAYFWMAAVDPAPAIVALATIEDRQNNFVHALYECQRGNNFIVEDVVNPNVADRVLHPTIPMYVDNKSETDLIVCSTGTANKLNELFVNCHPDVQLIASVPETIADLLKGFIADYCCNTILPVARRVSLAELAAGDVDLTAMLDDAAKHTIKQNIITALGGKYADNYLGLVEVQHEEDIARNLTNEYLEYLSFVSGDQLVATVDGIQTLIDVAKRMLRAVRALVAPMGYVKPEFNYSQLSNVMRHVLPRPTNSASAWWQDTRTVNEDRSITRTAAMRLPSFTPLVFNYPTFEISSPPPPPPPVAQTVFTPAEVHAALQPQPNLTSVQAEVVRGNRLRGRNI
jgi:hypothetical protein